jgi:hypothetical protein
VDEAQRPSKTRAPGIDTESRFGSQQASNSSATTGYLPINSLVPSSKTATGGYKLTGITEVGNLIPIKLMLDRGWPDYNYPAPLNDPIVANYRAFLDWQHKNRGMQVDRLSPPIAERLVENVVSW